MSAGNGRSDRTSKQIEIAARTAIELRAGRTLTDTEWVAMRVKLLEFAGVLRAWDRETRRDEVMLGCYAEEKLKPDTTCERPDGAITHPSGAARKGVK